MKIHVLHFCWTTFRNKITYWKKWPSRLRVNSRLQLHLSGTNEHWWVNPLWSNDSIWQHRSWSTLAQVIGLLSDGTKPLPWLPEPMTVDLSLVRSSVIRLMAISQVIHQPLITKIRLKITISNFQLTLAGANKLIRASACDKQCMHMATYKWSLELLIK